MPSFKQLSEVEQWQLVSYLRSLAVRPDSRRQLVAIQTRDGRQIQGVRLNEDTFTVQIMDASGQVHSFDKTLADARGLPLPFITEVVLSEVAAIMADPDPARPVPFFHQTPEGPRFRLL